MSPVVMLAPDQPRITEPATFFSPLDQAELEFDKGNYDGARALYEDALTDNRFKEQRDLILFRLGMTYLLPNFSRGNWQAAAERFKKLDEYQGPFKTAAQAILLLHAEWEHTIGDKRQIEQKLKQLNTELEAYKQIDAVNRRTKGKRQ
jgi:tetratricopeptide (TPR) repeat protein